MNFYQIFENHFSVVLPEIFLTSAILLLLVFGVVYADNTVKNDTSIRSISWLSLITLGVTAFLVYRNPVEVSTLFHNMLIHDPLSNLVKLVVLFGAFASILMSFSYFKHEKLYSFEYPILILIASLALLLLVSAYDLISIYLAIELQALTLYVLAAMKRNSEFSTEAGLKYFILGALSSGFLLFGCSLVYGFTGMTNLGSLVSLFSVVDTSMFGFNGIVVGIVFLSAAVFFKLAAAPFHMWVPDVYEGAPTSVTAFFAITPKIALFAVLIRLFSSTFYGFVSFWQPLLIIVSIASMLVGAIAALYQTKIKRLLAYSAVGHVGYMLIGVAIGTPEGIQAVLAYSILYMITTIAIFGIILSLFSDKYGLGIKYITQLNGLSKTHPWIAFALSLMLFSLAGIPPLAGFYGKLYLFMAAMQSSFYLLSIIGILTSVIGTLYYIRLIKIMYFEEVDAAQSFTHPTIEQNLLISLTTIMIALFFLYPEPLFAITYKVASFLIL